MKIYSLLIIAVLLGCKKDAVSNDSSFSFTDKGNTWYVVQYMNFCRGCTNAHKITFGGDTIINKKTYKTVFDFTGDSIESNIKKGRLVGCLRETDDKKVYWYWGNEDNPPKDHLLFDFNVKQGDSVDIYVVKKIDSIKIQNQFRRRITLTSFCQIKPIKVWIEEIGDMADFIDPPICPANKGSMSVMVQGGSISKQTCFVKNGEIIYKDSTFKDCWNYKR